MPSRLDANRRTNLPPIFGQNTRERERERDVLLPACDYGNLGMSPSATRQTHGVISGLASIISAKVRS